MSFNFLLSFLSAHAKQGIDEPNDYLRPDFVMVHNEQRRMDLIFSGGYLLMDPRICNF